MKYWLFKTEPETFSWEMQRHKGAAGEPWSGVRNHQSNNNMKAMRLGDLGFFYHTGDEKQIVGIVEVIGEYRADPTDGAGKFGMVIVKAKEALPKPVTLVQCKAEPKLRDMFLVKFTRGSVQPVKESEWRHIRKMGGMK